MGDAERAELERRVRAGEWLLVGDVAELLVLAPKTVDRRITAGVIGVRTKAGGTWRLCDPADVIRLLDESRHVQRSDNTAGRHAAE